MADGNKYNIKIECGADFVLPFTWYDDNGTPVDLTGATVEAQLRETSSSPDAYDFICTHNGAGGRITLTLTQEVTSQVAFSYGVYDVFVNMPAGGRKRPLYGDVYVQDHVTKPTDGEMLYMIGIGSYDDLPTEGIVNRLYFCYDDRKIYRWNGTNYIATSVGNGIQRIDYLDGGTYRMVFDDGTYFDFDSVPRIMGVYDATEEYEKLDIIHGTDGATYIAKIPVPAGTALSNATYWQQMTQKTPTITSEDVSYDYAQTHTDLVTNTGTADAPNLHFKVPRGVTGNESIDDTAGEGDTDYVWSADKSSKEINGLKSALSNNGNTVYRLSNLVNTYEPYTISGTATSGSTAYAETVSVKNITLRAGERYIFEVSANEAFESNQYSYLHEANGTTITSLVLEAGQTNAHKTFVANGDYENAYIEFNTNITGITLTHTISIDSIIPAIEVLKNNAMQDILAIPLKNASGSHITNYRVYYFFINTGSVFYIKTKYGTSINLLATYADDTTGVLTGVNGNDKAVTVAKDIKYLGYYLPDGIDDILYIYGDVYLERRAELDQIKNIAEVKNGSFSIVGYVKSTGGINSTDTYAKRTDYIAVEQYDHLFVDTIIGDAGCSIAFFDQNKGFISADSVTGTKRNYTMAIPQSAKFVIFSAYAFPDASANLYVDGSVSRKQIIDEQEIDDLQTWSRKTFDTDAFGAFAKFGVCGDSLSVGYMDDSHGTAHGRNIYYSWGQVIARHNGNKCLNFGFSGCTTKTWYTNATHGRVELILPENLCQCYLVGLGANDSVNATNVGTASDINLSDYTQNADTFYGNYGKILQLILDTAQEGYVFAFTLPTLSYATDLKNNAIRGAIEKINSNRLFLVDLEQDYKHLFTSNFIADNVVGAHYNAIGYANIAKAIEIAVTDVINKHSGSFTDLAFAPYGTNDVIN